MHAIIINYGTCDSTYPAVVVLTEYTAEMLSDILIGKFAISHEYSRNTIALNGDVTPTDLLTNLTQLGCKLVPVSGVLDTNTEQEDW